MRGPIVQLDPCSSQDGRQVDRLSRVALVARGPCLKVALLVLHLERNAQRRRLVVQVRDVDVRVLVARVVARVNASPLRRRQVTERGREQALRVLVEAPDERQDRALLARLHRHVRVVARLGVILARRAEVEEDVDGAGVRPARLELVVVGLEVGVE